MGDEAKALFKDARNEVLLSAVVAWEIAIKRSLGKIQVTRDPIEALLAGGAQPLAISLTHAGAVEHLPHHHRDPFDRLLVAQASIEDAAIVTADPALRRYDVPIVW